MGQDSIDQARFNANDFIGSKIIFDLLDRCTIDNLDFTFDRLDDRFEEYFAKRNLIPSVFGGSENGTIPRAIRGLVVSFPKRTIKSQRTRTYTRSYNYEKLKRDLSSWRIYGGSAMFVSARIVFSEKTRLPSKWWWAWREGGREDGTGSTVESLNRSVHTVSWSR